MDNTEIEFETSQTALEYTIHQNALNDGFVYSIPYNKTCFVIKRPLAERDQTPFSHPTDMRMFKVFRGFGSDYMPNSGINGLKSMADGKNYDSKSEYYKSLKAAGCEIVGNEKQSTSSEVRGDFITKKDIAETIKQLGG